MSVAQDKGKERKEIGTGRKERGTGPASAWASISHSGSSMI